MKQYTVKKKTTPFHIQVEVPGSKSMTNRALLLAAMAKGTSRLSGVLWSDDSGHFLEALRALGFFVEMNRETKCVTIEGTGGVIPKKEAQINVGSAGTAARFLTAFLAMNEGTYVVDASEQMKKRPMRELLVALEQLGADIRYMEQEYCFPMTIHGIAPQKEKQTTSVELNIDRSSQFLSALLLVAPLRFDSLAIRLTGSRSARSYVEMTEQMMKQFGHPGVRRISENEYEVSMAAYQPINYQIEPDVSAACYFYAMAAVTGGSAVVLHMRRDSLQGDRRFLEVLCRMGCRMEWNERDQLMLWGPAGGRLQGIDASFSDFSDQALTAAAIAPYADSPVTIRGIAHTRGQESDRIAVIATELQRMGVRCEEHADGVTIYPGPVQTALVQTYNDHRAAMAFAITGLRAQGEITIQNPECCQKTFPEYFEILERLTAQNQTGREETE